MGFDCWLRYIKKRINRKQIPGMEKTMIGWVDNFLTPFTLTNIDLRNSWRFRTIQRGRISLIHNVTVEHIENHQLDSFACNMVLKISNLSAMTSACSSCWHGLPMCLIRVAWTQRSISSWQSCRLTTVPYAPSVHIARSRSIVSFLRGSQNSAATFLHNLHNCRVQLTVGPP